MTHTTPSYRFSVEDSPTQYDPVRERIASGIAAHYSGWCNAYDRQFDTSSKFLFLHERDKDDLIAASRLVFRNLPDTSLPIELADRPFTGFDHDSLAVEYSGFWFKGPSSGGALACLGAMWMAKNFPDLNAYVLFDDENRVMQRIYLKTMNLTIVNHPPIVFQSFQRLSSSDAVQWTLAVDDAERRDFRIESFLKVRSLRDIVKSTTPEQFASEIGSRSSD